MRVAIVSTYPPGAFAGSPSSPRTCVRRSATRTPRPRSTSCRSSATNHNPHPPRGDNQTIRQDVRSDYARRRRPLLSRLRRRADRARVRHLRRRGRLLRAVAGPGTAAALRRHAAHCAVRPDRRGRPRCSASSASRAALVTVFTETARRMVVDAGIVAGGPGAGGAARRPDGCCRRSWPDATAPTTPLHDADGSHATMAQLEGRTVLSTFGLISAGKGIETAIEALADDRRRCTPRCCTWSPARPTRRWSSRKASAIGSRSNGWSATAGSTEHVQFLDRFLPMAELAVPAVLHRPVPDPLPVAGADRLRRAHLRGRRRLPGGLDPVLLRRGSAGLRRGRPGAVRRPERLRHGRAALLDNPDRPGRGRARRRGGSGPGWPGPRVGAPTRRGAGRSAHDRGAGAERRRPGRVASSPPDPPRPPARPWSTTSASCSTPTASCRIAPPATASTTWPGWPIVALGPGPASPATATYTPDADARPELPAARLGLRAGRHAQLHVLRPALARRRRTTATTSGGRSGPWAPWSPRIRRAPEAAPSLRLLDRDWPTPRGGSDSLATIAFAVLGLTRPPPDRCRPALQQPAADSGRPAARRPTPSTARDDWRWFEDDADLRQRPAPPGPDRGRSPAGRPPS